MRTKPRHYSAVMFIITLLVTQFFPLPISACGGKDVLISEDPALLGHSVKQGLYDNEGNLLIHKSEVFVSSQLARAIAEKFVIDNIEAPPLPLSFRKLEYVHGKLVYQFESGPVDDYNGKYHLGPVNFRVEGLMLDVDAVTGNLYLATGCGSAPSRMVYAYNAADFSGHAPVSPETFASNNTNFIARKTGNLIRVDGNIDPDEWKNTGRRYFYLGTYRPHSPSQTHSEPYYYAEVRIQTDDANIYFAVKTDTPDWLGIMFKDNANLGMLWSYKDAKVMKSNGEITDRYFTKRHDKTYFLKNDKRDDVLAKGNRQNDFYTYEFVFPLNTGDDQDISFEFGKAYNMLLLVGNTLEHYGIFTLDKAHANHDHSKNNQEHADVWASNETMFRIGTAADRDIYGAAVADIFTNYDSGFDPFKTDNHFHYAAAHLKEYAGRASFTGVLSWLSVLIGVLGAGLIAARIVTSSSADSSDPGPEGLDLMKVKWLRRILLSKYFRYIFIAPTLVVFFAIIYLGVFDVQDGQRNIATVFTWTLWWSLIIFSLILMGRFWCMMCPFAFIGDLAQKVVSLNRRLPGWLQNMGLQTIGFLVLTWAFTILSFSSRPFVTAAVILVILAAAIVFSIVYERRSFCRHVCPIGAVIGIYSLVSPIELRPCNSGRCNVHARKTCSEVCPMLESPDHMDNNVYCNFCMKCQSACPSKNLSLRIRSFGKDLYTSVRKSPAEAAAALFLLGVVIVETLAMTSSWEPLKNAFSSFTGISSPAAVYTIVFLLVLLVPVAIFYLICYLLKLWLGKETHNTQDLVKDFAFLFIPLGVSLHFAHNIQHLLIESPIAVPATIRFLHNIGLGASLSVNWNPAPLLGLAPIFFLQMFILLGGFAFTFYVLYRLLRRYQKPLCHIYKVTFAMSLYAIVIVVSAVYMLGLPMSGRHVH